MAPGGADAWASATGFALIDVTAWEAAEPEPAGGDEKVWLADGDGVQWLFKPRTEHGHWHQGEDWAEKVVSEVAVLLGVPCAQVELAARGRRLGSISRNLRDRSWRLDHGEVLLREADPDYRGRTKERTGHTLDAVEAVLRDVEPPAQLPAMTSFEVFAGFLVLDALVANSDRHEQNWAVLTPLPGRGVRRLAPSYDHGSSLGFNLQDGRRARLLQDAEVSRWSERGEAQRFEAGPTGVRHGLVELAHLALRRCRPEIRTFWLDRVGELDESGLMGSLACADEVLSDAARRFAYAVMTVNRRRLLA